MLPQTNGKTLEENNETRTETLMDKIQLLPDSVANQIAAGEVIQRPASVIKELVENSVDAGAKQIDVIVENAGKTSIQVVDDGMGMSVTDARLAFERHATSKIRKAEDLFSLHTMGFRGEALPSIASVAQVTLKTRREEDKVGTSLRIEGGKLVGQEVTVCPAGCNFLVENLFFNVPVRRRFLKANSTELNNIITAFQRIALVYPDIAFSLKSNGQELYNLQPTNTHRRIVDIFGMKLNPFLLPVEVETSLGKITGFVGKPEAAHKKNVHQYFFVNGRFMKHSGFHRAVQSVYDRLIPQGEQVPYFIYFTINPEDIDVNIHPTKTEIKFQDEQAVWQILAAAVKETVGKYNTITAIDFDTEDKPDIPVLDGTENIVTPRINVNPRYNPFSTDGSAEKKTEGKNVSAPMMRESSLNYDVNNVPTNWEKLYSGFDIATEKTEDEPSGKTSPATEETLLPQSVMSEDIATSRSSDHYQYKGAYILTSVDAGLMVTNQGRAHERVLYERYMKEMDSKRRASQRLLFPETVQFTIAEMMSLPAILPEMEKLGFEMTNLGGGTYAINAIPSELETVNVTRLVSDMVNSATEQDSDLGKELFSALAATMARNASITYGQVLTNEEMEQIISDLLKCENSKYTPDGKPISRIIPHDSIVSGL